MNLKKLFALGGVGIALAAVAAGNALASGGTTGTPAAGGTTVTVRVEGLRKTLLSTRTVHVGSGWITRYGARKGQCPASSVQGALDVATRHGWRGTWSTKYGPEYEITSILGETHSFTSKYYWDILTNNVAASAGACELKLHRGEQVLFAAVPVSPLSQYPLGISVPRHLSAGRSFDVKVVYYDASGKPKPLAGATVTVGGISAEPIPHNQVKARTNAKGIARLTERRLGLVEITANKAGSSKVGYIRAAAVARDVT